MVNAVFTGQKIMIMEQHFIDLIFSWDRCQYQNLFISTASSVMFRELNLSKTLQEKSICQASSEKLDRFHALPSNGFVKILYCVDLGKK